MFDVNESKKLYNSERLDQSDHGMTPAQINAHITTKINHVCIDLLQLLLQPIMRHFENRKGPDSRLAEKTVFRRFSKYRECY